MTTITNPTGDKVNIARNSALADQVQSQNRNALWTFLNSSLGLWLLSAVFITGAGTLYTAWKTSFDQKKQRRETADRLDFEIGYRFSQVAVRFCQLLEDSNSPQLAAFPTTPAKGDRQPSPCDPIKDNACKAAIEGSVR